MPCSGPVQQSIACNEQPCPGIAVSLTVSKTKGLCQKLCLIEVDGEFTFWSDNGPCTKTCGTGSQEQTRTCTNPAPQHGGLPCEGPTQQTVACNNQPCPNEHIFVKYAPASLNSSVMVCVPVNGGFTDWTESGSCSTTCGAGNQTQLRSCTNPIPQHGGLPCQGPLQQVVECNVQPCPGMQLMLKVGLLCLTIEQNVQHFYS